MKIPDGDGAHKTHEAERVAKWLDDDVMAVKAQVHAGGRGKAGGLKFARSVGEAVEAADQMPGMTLITAQTGAKGREVRRVYIEAGCDIERQMYFSILNDRDTGGTTAVAVREGGVDVEKAAQKAPESIIKIRLGPGVHRASTTHARSPTIWD